MSRKPLPYETIVKAQRGEPEAVDTVLSHYAGYIKYTAAHTSSKSKKGLLLFLRPSLVKIEKFRSRK